MSFHAPSTRPTLAGSRARVRLAGLVAIPLLVLVTLPATRAHAQQEHTVRQGQTLSHIAARYHVSVSSLAAANGLRRDAALQVGQILRVPERGVVYVREGQTLSHVARAHGLSVTDLARANRIQPTTTLQVGQRLVLPGHETAREAQAAEARWGRPRQPGLATFHRVSKRERVRIRLVDNRGVARSAARQQLARVMRHAGSNSRRLPHPRLVQLLARVSDHFGGRRILVVSGYRPAGGYTRETSRHVAGRALDFRIDGVPNRELRDYLRTLPDVGVGFYPRSSFVHLDVRDRSAYWVDWAGRGQAPRYDRRGGRPDDATDEELERAGLSRPAERDAGEEAAAEAENEAEGTPDRPDDGGGADETLEDDAPEDGALEDDVGSDPDGAEVDEG